MKKYLLLILVYSSIAIADYVEYLDQTFQCMEQRTNNSVLGCDLITNHVLKFPNGSTIDIDMLEVNLSRDQIVSLNGSISPLLAVNGSEKKFHFYVDRHLRFNAEGEVISGRLLNSYYATVRNPKKDLFIMGITTGGANIIGGTSGIFQFANGIATAKYYLGNENRFNKNLVIKYDEMDFKQTLNHFCQGDNYDEVYSYKGSGVSILNKKDLKKYFTPSQIKYLMAYDPIKKRYVTELNDVKSFYLLTREDYFSCLKHNAVLNLKYVTKKPKAFIHF